VAEGRGRGCAAASSLTCRERERERVDQLISAKLDEMPARPELMQYEKRFVELYEQVCG
jgi:hypothetical protein